MSRRLSRALAALALVAGGPLAAQDWRTLDVARQTRDSSAAPLHVRVGYGAGKATVRAADSQLLYEMQLRYDARRGAPLHTFDPAGRALRLGLDREGSTLVGGGRDAEGSEMRLGLSRTVPLDLTIDLGAVEADLDLSGLRLEALTVSTGASDTRLRFDTLNAVRMRALDLQVGAASVRATRLANANAGEVRVKGSVGAIELDFGGEWTRDVRLSVGMTLGSVTVRVPRDVGVRLELDRVLSAFDHPRMTRQGNAWVSENWATAKHHLVIVGRSTLGAFELDHQ